jgi:hypothetical protein
MSWPVILSGVVCVTMLALGFNLLLPLGGGLETVCVLIAVASAIVFFGLVDGAERNRRNAGRKEPRGDEDACSHPTIFR